MLLLNHSHESLRAADWNAALDDDTVAGDARFPDGRDPEVYFVRLRSVIYRQNC